MKVSRIVMIGRFGPPFLAFARSCGRRGIEVYSAEVRSATQWEPQSAFLKGGVIVDPALLYTTEGLQFVKNYASAVRPDALVGMGDQLLLWLSRNREHFEPACKLMVPEADSLCRLFSKRYQLELAQRIGFDLLPTWMLFGGADIRQVPLSAYPICLRPSTEQCVRPSFKAKVIHEPGQGREFLSSLHIEGEPIIAQPFRSAPNLVVHGVRSQDGEMLAMNGFLVYRKFEGVGLSIRTTSLPREFRELCTRFAAASGITGPFHYDFLLSESEGRTYYLETNARLGGTTEKVLRLGYDEPALALKAFGFDINIPSGNTNRGSVVNKRALLKHIIAAWKGNLTELDYPEASRWKSIAYSCWEMVSVRDSVFDWGDLQGSRWFHLRGPQ